MSFIQGYLAGLAMVIFVGPVLFYLLRVSLEFGTKSGLLVALGIFFSDVVAAWLCYVGVGKLLQSESSQTWLAFGGGVILLILGVKYALQKGVSSKEIREVTMGGKIMFFVNGFLVNFINPFVFGVWILMVAYVNNSFELEAQRQFFLVGALLGVISTDSAKVFLAGFIQPYLKAERLRVVYRVAGGILILFALRLLYFGVMRMLD